MLSWIVLIVVLVALVILGTWAWGTIFGRGEVLPPLDEPRSVMASNRRAVEEGDFRAIAFEVVPRGYHQDQVDDLLAALEAKLRAR